MMMTLYNSLTGINEAADEATYRLSGTANLIEGASSTSPPCRPRTTRPCPPP